MNYSESKNLMLEEQNQYRSQSGNMGPYFYSWFSCHLAISIAASTLLLLLLASSFYQQNLHTGSHILIMHLMFIQLIICAVLSPIHAAVSHQTVIENAPRIDCHPFMLIYIVCYDAENWSTVLIAFNRFVALKLPHHYRKWLTKQALAATMFLPWLIAFSLTLPVYFGVGGDFILNTKNGACSSKTSGPYLAFFLVASNYIPVALISLTYGTMLLHWLIKQHCRAGAVVEPYQAIRPAEPAGKSKTRANLQNVDDILRLVLSVFDSLALDHRVLSRPVHAQPGCAVVGGENLGGVWLRSESGEIDLPRRESMLYALI